MKIKQIILFILLLSITKVGRTQSITLPPLYITNNTIWNSITPAPGYNVDIVVTCNNSLTIDGLTIDFINTAIIVQPGATLILKNTILQGGVAFTYNPLTGTINSINSKWYGIKLWGKLIMDHATISNADIGLWIRDDALYIPDNTGPSRDGFPTEPPCTVPATNGAKVVANYSKFIDNGMCVYDDNYYRTTVNFNYCDFLAINPIRSNGALWFTSFYPLGINGENWPQYLIQGTDCGKLNFTGCALKGPANPLLPNKPMISGMHYEYDANIASKDIIITTEDVNTGIPGTVNPNWRNGNFENLLTGIEIINEGRLTPYSRNISVIRQVFSNVVTGFTSYCVKDINLLCNSFNAISFDSASMDSIEFHNFGFHRTQQSGRYLYTSLTLKGGSCFALIKNGYGFHIDGNTILWPQKFTSAYYTDRSDFKSKVVLNGGFGIIIFNNELMNTPNNTITGNLFFATKKPGEANKCISGISILGDYQNCAITCNTFEGLKFDWFLFSTVLIPVLPAPNPPPGSPIDIGRNLNIQGDSLMGLNNNFSVLDSNAVYIYEQNIFCNFEADFKYYAKANALRSRKEPVVRSEWMKNDLITGNIYYWEYYILNFNQKMCNYTFFDWDSSMTYVTLEWAHYDSITNITTYYFSKNERKTAADEINCTYNCQNKVFIKSDSLQYEEYQH